MVEKDFYPPIRNFIASGQVVVDVISRVKVTESWRKMMGATCPDEVLLGTIRGDVVQVAGEDEAIQNIVYGSDSEVSTKCEIALWFKD